MDEKLLSKCITQAVESRCAHLHADPLLAQKVIRAAERKEKPIVRSKMKYGLILALILTLMAATAVAAVLLTGMEVIRQEAVPLAQGNDGQVRPVEEYTYEELLSIVMTAKENGIVLDEDTSVMRALRMGEGYSEEETIMAICREAFGGLFYEWTVEERHFFQDMMIEIGWATENHYPLPSPNDLPSEEIRALAVETIHKHYGEDVHVEDRSLFRRQEDLYRDSVDGVERNTWAFTFYPRTLDESIYHVTLDGQGQWADHNKEPGYNWEVYTEEDLVHRVDSVYNYRYGGCGMTTWEYDAWHAFGERLPGANKSDNWDEEYDAYAASKYLLPGEGDITKQQAREIAFADAGVKDYTSVMEILLGRGEQRVWKITFNTAEKTGKNQRLSYEINAQTREILRVDDLTTAKAWAAYVLHQTYEGFVQENDGVTHEEAIALAVKTLHEHFGDDTIPYMDENIYTIDARHNPRTGGYTVLFNVKQLGYGRANVTVKADGTTSLVFANPCGLNGDTLFKCYDDVYGSCFDWEQSRWVEFGQAMQQYEPTSFEGKLFKQTTYVEESAVKLSRDDALDVVWKDAEADHICAILIGAEPNPVWKVRANTNPVTTLYEIDAMTGEILDRELYYIQMPNFDHEMKMYTLRRDFMPAHLAEFGVARVAMELCVKAYPNEFEQYGDSPDIFLDESRYATTVDGMTVTFAGYAPSDPSYRVTVAEDAMSANVEKISNADAHAASNPDLSAVYAQYGENSRYWPIKVQHDYLPGNGYSLPEEGEMTYEEALAHARKLIVDEIGENAFDGLEDCTIGAHMIRYTDGSGRIAWYFYFTDNPATEENGWRVTFFIENGELKDFSQVQHVKEYGNG